MCVWRYFVCFFNQKTAYEMRISDWSSDVCSSDLNIGMQHCLAQGTGHLVAISSIAGLRGGGDAPAYNASKAFVSNYMEGLRQNMARRGLPIATTDVRPGFVDTAMAKGDGLFWVASPEKAANQNYGAIRARKSHA